MTDTTHPGDDLVAAFQIDGQPVRGRIARLGGMVDDILTRHDYPAPVANLLGEACALAALVGASLKFEGRLILQAQGDGPVGFVVADYDTSGALRGYCRYDADRVAEVSTGFALPGAQTLLGKGVFVMTIDQGADMDRYQGVTPIEGETLALCAEHYFAQSDQVPTRANRVLGAVVSVRSACHVPLPLRTWTSYVVPPAPAAVAHRSVQPLPADPVRRTGTSTAPVIDGWIVQR